MFSPDGTQLLTAGSDGFIIVWKPTENYSNFEKVSEVEAFPKMAKDVHWSLDGNYIVAVQERGEAKIWSFEMKDKNRLLKQVHSLKPSDAHEFNGCRFGTSGRTLYTSEMVPRKSGKIAKWTVTDKGCNRVKTSKIFSNCHHTVFDISSCGNFLAVASVKGDVLVLRSSNLSPFMSVHVHDLPVPRLRFTKKKRTQAKETRDEDLAVVSCGLDMKIVSTPVRENMNSFRMVMLFTGFVLLFALIYQFFLKQ